MRQSDQYEHDIQNVDLTGEHGDSFDDRLVKYSDAKDIYLCWAVCPDDYCYYQCLLRHATFL